jgi:DNA polymerase-1
LTKVPALKQLTDAISAAVYRNGQLKAIDGRYIPVRHKHAALNTLLQSAGSIMCKLWVVKFHDMMQARGFIHGKHYQQLAYVHDELQISVDKKLIPITIDSEGKQTSLVGEICVEAIRQVGIDLGLRLPLDGEYKIGSNYAETH